ncbi:peptidoglycan editing factor PgeF [Hyphomonas sp.]|uniref:peptidoglycan editing factor PgeF n=1 Tax=Hyphomonas sp. TaxID=87 RepID=UPI00391DF2AD
MHPPYESAPILTGFPGLFHGFFGRRGGVSEGLYESLNTGPGSADAPENIKENRARIAAIAGAAALVSCYQVHSPDVVRVTAPWETGPKADAMVTDVAGIALCVLSADCTPVLFADPEAGVIGAAHAGWKGALAGVLVNTVREMAVLGAQPERIRAAIGPAIQQESYEVGPEFREAFLAGDSSCEGLFRPGRGDRLHFDLPGFCQRQLERAGVGAIFNLGHDTCGMEAAYFSNRRRHLRGEADYGRNASVVTILA